MCLCFFIAEQFTSKHRILYMKQFIFICAAGILAATLALVTACVPAANVSPQSSTAPPTTRPTEKPTESLSTPATPTAKSGAPTATMSQNPPQNTGQAANQLVQALELALDEMRAAQTDTETAAAKTRTQSSLNILVGKYGRWYSAQAPDPSNKLGVLPGEIQPQGGGADGDRPPPPSAGLALLTMGTTATPSPELVIILGDVKLWQSNPRAGYDSIAKAVETADTAQMQLGKLDGAVPRAVAWQRLTLTQAQTAQDLHAFAAQAISELETALAAAREIAK